jgi:cyanophycinase-like exopeptidase
MRLALNGGEEFSDGFENVHAELIEIVGGANSCGVYLPCAAADDGMPTVDFWRNLALKRLTATGSSVTAPRIVDHASANLAENVEQIANADWIYLGGGKPHVAMRVLAGTKSMEALQVAIKRNVLIIGASAGAMMMCSQSVVLTDEALAIFEAAQRHAKPGEKVPGLPPLQCLGLIPDSICFPHFNRSYARTLINNWDHPAGMRALCIDEQTSLDNVTGEWLVRGRGTVSIVDPQGKTHEYRAGEKVSVL